MHVLPLITLVAASIPRTTAAAPTPADTALRFDINLSRPMRTTEHVGTLSRLGSQAFDGELCLDALCKGNDHSYLYADLYVGGSKTPTKVILDTGSSDTWVTGSTCHSSVQDAKDGACEPNEAGSVTVTPTKFNSTGKTAKTIYGQRDKISVDYAIYKTSIKFGSAEVSNFPVGVVYQMSGEVTVRGVLGLGFNSLSKIEQAFKGAENANFLDALKVSRFGIYVSPLDPTKGQVNFGHFNDKKYGVPGRELQWFPVIPVNGQYGHWIIDSSQMIISTIDYTRTERFLSYMSESKVVQGKTLVDSGSPLLTFTRNTADIINGWYNATYIEKLNQYRIPCEGGRSLILSLARKSGEPRVEYTIPYSSLVSKSDSGECYSLIMNGAEDLGMSCFGSPFHQAAYIAHDKASKTMGFIPLNPKLMASTKSFWSF